METIPRDHLGPARILQLYDPQLQYRAYVVIDNVSLGPAIGGVRIRPDVTPLEVYRLARAMTLKNASSGLNHGGGKAGIVTDPRRPDLEEIVRSFARLISDLTDYIPGPDMGSNEQVMVWIKEENGRAVGLPAELGGLPLDQLGATGFGVAIAAEVAAGRAGLSLDQARVAIQGYGNVGAAAARFLAEKGSRIVAVSDRSGTLYHPAGLDIDHLDRRKLAAGKLEPPTGSQLLPTEALFELDCDLLIPAAIPDVINAGNQAAIKARLIVEGANIPATLEAETALAQRGVLIIPDFIANAGGVIMAAMEYRGATAEEAFTVIERQIRANTEQILAQVESEQVLPRTAAEQFANQRLSSAMAQRSWSRSWR